MLKKWDKVLYPFSSSNQFPATEYICKTDEEENINAWCNIVFLEWLSGWVDVSFCKKIESKSEVEKVLELVQIHWEEKVIKWIEIMYELLEKDLQELEFIAKQTKSEATKKIIKLVMDYKINKI